MNIRILGAHHFESGTDKYSCFVIDGKLAVDAGALTSTLSTEEQRELEGVLITHAHFDHIRDIPCLAANLFGVGEHTNIYAPTNTKQIIESHLLNNIVYPNFFKLPVREPTLSYQQIIPGKIQTIHGYSVLPLQTNHSEDALGYNITDKYGETLFYTGDTGPGLSSIWPQIDPHVLIIEVTLPDRLQDFAMRTGHLTPELLRQELEELRRVKGYLPRILTIHMDRMNEEEIKIETENVSASLNTNIVLAHEGLEINLQKDDLNYHFSDIQVPSHC
jgi:ribonuclease BN (tRNA processing enzyme)